jgi:hypothetical protein
MTDATTEYVYVSPASSRGTRTSAGGSQDRAARLRASAESDVRPGLDSPTPGGLLGRAGGYLKGQAVRQVQTPPHVPAILGHSGLIKACWLGSMVVVSVEAIMGYGVLPPPGRLFWISSTYALLAVAGSVDAMLPLVNALALGYLIVLIWQASKTPGALFPASWTETASAS